MLVELDEDTTAHGKAHIQGAVKLDWKKDLQDPVRRDFADRAGFEALLSERRIANDDTVILYGGSHRSAAYACWYFKLYGYHSVKLLDPPLVERSRTNVAGRSLTSPSMALSCDNAR